MGTTLSLSPNSLSWLDKTTFVTGLYLVTRRMWVLKTDNQSVFSKLLHKTHFACQYVHFSYFNPRNQVPKHNDFLKLSRPCHVGIHWIALAEYTQMSTHMPGFQPFSRLIASFCIDQMSNQQHNDDTIYVINAKNTRLRFYLCENDLVR